jgi:hypothetical protein
VGDPNAAYIVVSLTASLNNERMLGVVPGLTLTDGGANGTIIIGFHVRPAGKAAALAEQEGVDIKLYDIIYQALDDVKLAMAGLQAPEGEGTMSKANEYEIKVVKWEGRPDVEGPAMFRKADGEKVVAAWVPGTEMHAVDSDRGAVAVIDAPDSDRVYFYLDA